MWARLPDKRGLSMLELRPSSLNVEMFERMAWYVFLELVRTLLAVSPDGMFWGILDDWYRS